MSELDARTAPARGRSTIRGGRGGFSRGGPRGGRKINGTDDATSPEEESLEDQGEIGEMKKKYATELPMLRDMFTGWTDTDLVFALEESGGDLSAAVEKISQGSVSQFAEVKKPKDRARSKAKEEPSTAGAADKVGFAARGGRGRGGFDSTRGSRGRGADRGRGGFRGARGGHATTNGTIKEAGSESVPTAESTAWNTEATTAEGTWDTPAADAPKDITDAGAGAWGAASTTETAAPAPAAAPEAAKSTAAPASGAKKSWASMFAAPKPVSQKQILTKETAPAAVVAAGIEAPPAAAQAVLEKIIAQEDPAQSPDAEPLPLPTAAPTIEEPLATAPAANVPTPATVDTDAAAEPDPLTEENVEHLPDESHPPATQTVASTAGSADPRNLTPMPNKQAPIGRPPLGGYAVSANRLAGSSGRSASFQRRVQEQQEAVVMPGHNAVDRAAVQFGSMGLNGEPGPDVDEEREEPETRHAPQHSPPSQPKTSLPPAPRETAAPQAAPGLPEALPTPKQAPGLPPASAQNQQQIQDPALAQSLPQEQQMPQAYNQYARYGQPGMPQQQQESGTPQQKPYDPFSQQGQQSHYDQYAAQHQQPQQQAQQAPAGFGLSSAPSEYSQYYTSDQTRNAYNQYYGSSYGQQDTRGHPSQAQPQVQHEALGPQRSASGFGAGANESAFGSQAQQTQSRFAEAPGSGNNTPNQVMSGHQQAAPSGQQSQHMMHQVQAQAHQGGYNAAGFPYGHPYYNSPYQTAYQNQFGYSQPAGYGGYPQGQGQKGGMYGQPHAGYGMGSQSSFDQHSSSPANANAFAQNQQSSMRSTSGMGSGLGGLDDYQRSSAQSGAHQQSSNFGGMNDPFARSTSGFGTQGYGQQMSTAGPEDSLKPFSDSKGGPSPALGQPGRPGSAANSAAGVSQSGLPPPQGQHSGYGGYPGFQNQSSQYGGLGGLGSHQGSQGAGQQSGYGAQQSAYGGYGGFNQTYGNYGQSRGGWSANYGGH
ncbi:hypothetical protein CLAFUW4_11307 [Fulvia fulva]|nr:hypothetical protein CLAFUR4_11313 [Fulvia fulva]WPV17413.1 hypothetical protein CLAFUW4_11307 [Fulvia fulva]WPV32220.1 hypothetical protein CLAFUW7_11303 [Fulvia fulva]